MGRYVDPIVPEYHDDEESKAMDKESRWILRAIEVLTTDYFYNMRYFNHKKHIDEKWELQQKVKNLRQRFIVRNMHKFFGY
jgi:hypothetical protein